MHVQLKPDAAQAYGVLYMFCAYAGFLPTIICVQMAIALALLALPFRAGGAQRVPT